MATAEQLLHEAQYAFQNIGYDESWSSRRNAAKAKSLCKKILRRHPTSMEAIEARSILQRLDDEAYTTRPVAQKLQGIKPRQHRPVSQPGAGEGEEFPGLNWGGLVSLLFTTPKIILGFIAIVLFLLFDFLGWVLLLPLAALVLFTGPLRHLAQGSQRDELQNFIGKVNDWIEERSGPG